MPLVAARIGCKTDVLQLTPQIGGKVTSELIDRIVVSGQRARLHANCRVLDRHCRLNLDSVPVEPAYFAALAAASRRLGAEAYTLHPGYTINCTRQQLADNLDHLEQIFECPVGVEAMYPNRMRPYHLADWSGYGWLLESGVRYAIDLSHIHILATHTNTVDHGLVRALLQSDRLLELHISSNDGFSDSHGLSFQQEWWHDLLTITHPETVIFCESDCRALLRYKSLQDL